MRRYPQPYIIHTHPAHYARRSGLVPLIEQLQAVPVLFDVTWERLQQRSWTLGHAVRRIGQWYYGSTWNALAPIRDDWRAFRALPRRAPCIVHYLFAEFAAPKLCGPFRRASMRVVATFHASARRLPHVARRMSLRGWDRISVMSRSQIDYFVGRGIPRERIDVTRHGVDTDFFAPDPRPRRTEGDALAGILVGSTERDHEFMAAVLKKLPGGMLKLSVRTADENRRYYTGAPHVEFLPTLNDHELVAAYRAADLMLMPMLDCTANNAILEAMACGTPVVTNRVGGIPEYVDAASNFITDEKRVDEWVALLRRLASDRSELITRRPKVRAWAETLSWRLVAEDYRKFYELAAGSAA